MLKNIRNAINCHAMYTEIGVYKENAAMLVPTTISFWS